MKDWLVEVNRLDDVDYKKAESYRLIGSAFEVYNDRGHGLGEEIYQECLEIEFEIRDVPFLAKPGLECVYKGRTLKKRYVPDLIVFETIIVELKSVSEIIDAHKSQLLNYMRITRQPLGYLLNFGKRGGLDYHRFILSEFL